MTVKIELISKIPVKQCDRHGLSSAAQTPEFIRAATPAIPIGTEEDCANVSGGLARHGEF